MSLFPRSAFHPFSSHNNTYDTTSSSFHPLFRLLDDFDNYSRTNDNSLFKKAESAMKSFTPQFDVTEKKDVYELHGNLPGVEQKDVEIEFVDAQTLVVKGRAEREDRWGSSEEGQKKGKAPAAVKDKEHQPTVEDADENTSTEVTTTKGKENGSIEVAKKEPETKYWVSEREVGEFVRSFTFPVRVDQDAVKASMKNGVLSVVVPKAKKIEGKKIEIQ